VDNVADGLVQRHGASPKGKRRRQLLMLQALPGIGKKRARLLLDEFGSVGEMVNASYDKLRRIDGIGAKLADDIRHTLSEPSTRYDEE
jgi:ERCC4-type nuclease